MKNKFVVIMLCALVMFVAKGAEADSSHTSNDITNITANTAQAITSSSASIDTAIKTSAFGGVGGAATNGSQLINIDQGQIRQSPAVFMNAPAPTAPCQATAGGFVSFIAGGGFAASYTLEECEIRESSRIAHGIGQQHMAKEIICMGKFAKMTPSCTKELKDSYHP